LTDPAESENPIDRRVGAAILRRRSQLGLSLGELAQAAHIPIPALGDYESGRRRALAEDLRRIAAVLDVPPNYFFRPGPAETPFD